MVSAPKKPKVEENVVLDPQKFEDKVSEGADSLLRSCSKVRVRKTWFSTSSRVDDTVIADITHMNVENVRAAMSSGKRLLKSKHPALVATKQAFQAISDYINSMTIPLVALQSSGDDENMKKDGGTRVIQKKDMSTFDNRLNYLVGILKTATADLQKAMPEIKAEDRTRLAKVHTDMYKDSDYPEDVTKVIGVSWSYEPIGVDVEWEKLCPEIYERERLDAKKKYEAVVENAACEFAQQFIRYVRQVTEQLGNRVRLNPRPGHEIVKAIVSNKEVDVTLDNAEVTSVLTHKTDPDTVPEDHVHIRVRLQIAGGRNPEVWLAEPIREDYYRNTLCPYETEERKKLFASTVANLKSELETFLHVGDMLGPYKSLISNSVNEVKTILSSASASMNPEHIVQELRSGSFFRTQMHSVLEGVAHRVESEISTVAPKRRTIKKALIGNL